MKYFDHRFIWLLFRTHIFQNTYFLKAPPVIAPLKRQCHDNIWKFEQNKVKNLLSFFQFLNLLKKVIGKKLQPPWKYHPPPPPSKNFNFYNPLCLAIFQNHSTPPKFRWSGYYGFATHALVYFVRGVFPNWKYSS